MTPSRGSRVCRVWPANCCSGLTEAPVTFPHIEESHEDLERNIPVMPLAAIVIHTVYLWRVKGPLVFRFGIFTALVSAHLFIDVPVEREMRFDRKQDVVEVPAPTVSCKGVISNQII